MATLIIILIAIVFALSAFAFICTVLALNFLPIIIVVAFIARWLYHRFKTH